jgi:peptidoglycan/LPS O-acetylase OafA/YrhL
LNGSVGFLTPPNLWNYPIALWISDGTGRLTFDQGVVSIVASVVAATLSWFAIEMPASKFKRLTSEPAAELPVRRAVTLTEVTAT